MWPLPKIQYEQVCLTIDASNATLAWLTESSQKQCTLKAYTTIAWDKSNHILAKELYYFVQKNRLQNALMNIALATPLIHEQLVRLSTASPQVGQLGSSMLKRMLWDYRYLHTLDDGQSLFYVCGITRHILFFYLLLAQQSNLHLMNITSGYMALINMYAKIYGPAFRRSQLALDLLAHDYQLEKSITLDSIARLLYVDPALTIDIDEQKIPLITTIGLFNQERK
jgi:hypothetical protein